MIVEGETMNDKLDRIGAIAVISTILNGRSQDEIAHIIATVEFTLGVDEEQTPAPKPEPKPEQKPAAEPKAIKSAPVRKHAKSAKRPKVWKAKKRNRTFYKMPDVPKPSLEEVIEVLQSKTCPEVGLTKNEILRKLVKVKFSDMWMVNEFAKWRGSGQLKTGTPLQNQTKRYLAP